MALKLSSLQWRLISAAVLIPVVVLIIWSGRYVFGAFLGVFAGLALYELWTMVRSGRFAYVGFLLGGLYVALSFLLCYQIRENYGVLPMLLFFFSIWGSDTGAYVFGKIIGGPKMAGEISPNKTWAGYAGALIVPAIMVMLVGFNFDIPHLLAGLALGATGQAGDLLVSWLKRSVSVKDTGQLIPGHGGVLDRVDSLMLAAPVYIALLQAGFIL